MREVFTSTDLRGASRPLDKVSPLPIATTLMGLAKVYYGATIGEDPLVRQLAASIITGILSGWDATEISDHFGQSVLSPLGYKCVDRETGKRYANILAVAKMVDFSNRTNVNQF